MAEVTSFKEILLLLGLFLDGVGASFLFIPDLPSNEVKERIVDLHPKFRIAREFKDAMDIQVECIHASDEELRVVFEMLFPYAEPWTDDELDRIVLRVDEDVQQPIIGAYTVDDEIAYVESWNGHLPGAIRSGYHRMLRSFFVRYGSLLLLAGFVLQIVSTIL